MGVAPGQLRRGRLICSLLAVGLEARFRNKERMRACPAGYHREKWNLVSNIVQAGLVSWEQGSPRLWPEPQSPERNEATVIKRARAAPGRVGGVFVARDGGREQATPRATQTSDSTLIDSIADQVARAGDGAVAARGTRAMLE